MAKLPPKFKNPENLDQTWSGRGKKPAWMIKMLQAGVSIEAMRVTSGEWHPGIECEHGYDACPICDQ